MEQMNSSLQTHVLVFRTNVNGWNEINRIRPVLNGHSLIRQWSVDTEDIDKVLRVVCSSQVNESTVIELLTNANLQCNELQ
jgi:hypothetical protein